MAAFGIVKNEHKNSKYPKFDQLEHLSKIKYLYIIAELNNGTILFKNKRGYDVSDMDDFVKVLVKKHRLVLQTETNDKKETLYKLEKMSNKNLMITLIDEILKKALEFG